MIRGRTRTTRGLVAVAALGIVVALGGCASSGAADAERSASPPATATDEVVTVPMPDLGPYPTAAPLTPEEQEAARIAEDEQAWRQVLAQYPNAVRPSVESIEYVEYEERLGGFRSCLEDAGVPLEEVFDNPEMAPPPVSVNPMPATEAHAVDAFRCDASYPIVQTTRPHTPEQIGWLYDYATQFLVPCFEANGIENPEPPSKEAYIAGWPAPGWVPTSNPYGIPLDEERLAAIDEACPYDGTGTATAD